MTTYKLNKNFIVECKTIEGGGKYAFKHKATLYNDDIEIATNTITYINRTWERFTYESTIKGLLEIAEEYINKKQRDRFMKKISDEALGRVEQDFKIIGNLAKVGEVFSTNKKQANNFKKKVLKAGLGKGLSFPSDWDKLPAETQETRLNKAIETLTN